MIGAEEALARLREGNRRFVAEGGLKADLGPARRRSLVEGQAPFAVILGCSDSRVPAEIVFDQGFGDLFVIRVAGNVVAPSLTGSVEYAAEVLGTRLVVVVGHTRCGAVTATVDDLQRSEGLPSPNLRAIVERIRPAVAPLLGAHRDDRQALIREAVRANVRRSVEALRSESDILRRLEREDGLVIVGAEYALETGEVTFFE